jgi:hypothetical protein
VPENKVLRRIFGPKREGFQRSGENYIMRSLMICTLHQMFSCDKIEKEWAGRVARMGREEVYTGFGRET